MTQNESRPGPGGGSQMHSAGQPNGTDPRTLARDIADAVAAEDAYDRLGRAEKLALGQLYATLAIADALAGGA